ncbi:hypothetical protein MFIFM68171_06822 [Madurella fahalii]|uniref:Uncharacterized protein n=1 Tax=Madurella fahalii TaxID=1157608 RepID=A0ABQ0GFS1_9PEZI
MQRRARATSTWMTWLTPTCALPTGWDGRLGAWHVFDVGAESLPIGDVTQAAAKALGVKAPLGFTGTHGNPFLEAMSTISNSEARTGGAPTPCWGGSPGAAISSRTLTSPWRRGRRPWRGGGCIGFAGTHG